MLESIRRFRDSEDGQDLIEYSLLIVFIAIASMAFLGMGGNPTRAVWRGADARVGEAERAAS